MLYPDFLRRIDHYLKINYPHVWRTRVHDFAWFSLILGNAVAASLGGLVVGWNNVLSEDSVTILHCGFAVMLGFAGLFWAIRLLRFKMKFSDFKTLFITWVIYLLCLGSLGLNLATFTSSIAYRTAHLYSDDVVQTDYSYLAVVEELYYDETLHDLNECQSIEYDKKDYLKMYYTESLKRIVSRHNYEYNKKNSICLDDINAAKRGIYLLKKAKRFVRQPILGKDFFTYTEKTFYHDLVAISWFMLILAFLFLPASLFLLSEFGVQNLLISAFSTLIIIALPLLSLNMYFMSYGAEILVVIYGFITFILLMVLVIGRHRLKVWNYVGGVFMLMLGVVFFAFYIDIVESYRGMNISPFWIISRILPFSLLASLIAGWKIAKHNEQPIF